MTKRFTRMVGAVAAAALTATVVGLPGGPTASAAAAGSILYAGHPQAVPGSYVVVLADHAKAELGAAGDVAGQYGGQVTFTYTAALNGFAVAANPDQAKHMAADPRVAYVAQDLAVSLPEPTAAKPTTAPDAGVDVFVQLNPPSWGLDRVDQRHLPLDGRYHYPSTASSIRAYIIGTGIRYTHQEFGGRAIPGIDTVGGVSPPGADCNGHGTHMAGTVGGKNVGLAKGVQLVSVRVLNCSGAGSYSGVLAGINWVTQQNLANPRPSVANLSLGGPVYLPLNDAVTRSIAANVHYAVPTGSSNTDACNTSPGSTPRATTTGSADANDNRASFSNYGPCVDLFAPGVNIYSAWASADNAYNTISGSTATAHVTGAAALWRHRFPADNADQVAAALVANATPGQIPNPGPGSPNLLLYMGMIPV